MSLPPGHPGTYANVRVDPSLLSGKTYYGSPPPEALESDENRKYRESKTRMFRYLNNPANSTYRNSLKRKTGKEWKNIREKTIKNFKNELAAKEVKRAKALENFRNKEWTAYIEEWKRTHHPAAPGSGIPAQGHPIRLFGGLQKTRKRTYKKKHAVVKRSSTRKGM